MIGESDLLYAKEYEKYPKLEALSVKDYIVNTKFGSTSDTEALPISETKQKQNTKNKRIFPKIIDMKDSFIENDEETTYLKNKGFLFDFPEVFPVPNSDKHLLIISYSNQKESIGLQIFKR